MSLLDDVSIVVTPNGYKAGTLYGVLPTATLGSELLSQSVDLTTDFVANAGGVIVDSDTFTSAGGTFDGLVSSTNTFEIGKRYKLIISGNTTSSGFGFYPASGSGFYGDGFGTHYFTATHEKLWVRQQTSGTTNITSFSIKEFTASDMDVTRATAATRVDENGLVNHAEVLGGEEVTNGDFSDDLTGWTGYGTRSATGGVATIGASANSGIYQDILTEGVRYTVTVNVTSYDGVGTAEFVNGNGNNLYTITETGIQTFTFTHNIAASSLILRGMSNALFSVSSVSVKEYTASDMDVTRATAATRVDENGLVNHAEVLGGEEVTNGDFTTDGTPSTNTWTLGWYSNTANVSISGGQITLTNSASESSSLAYATNGVSSNNILTTNQLYKLQYQVVANNGVTSFKYYSSAGSFIDAPIDLGVTHTIYIKNTANQLFLFQNATTNSNISLDNVSVKEVTRDNVPRIDYTGGGCPHILAEPQRTNLITYSEDFTQWTKVNYTVQSNVGISPSGNNDASSLTNPSGGGGNIKQNTTVTASTNYTFSFYAKRGTASDVKYSVYDNTNGGDIIASTSYYSQLNSSTFTRVTVSFATPVGCTSIGVYILRDNGTAGTVIVWGAQLEAGSYATSYIPTSGSSVTRNQDVFTRDGISSLINDSEGVLFVEMAALANDGTFRGISISDGTNNNRIALLFSNNANIIRVQVVSNNSLDVLIDKSITTTQSNKFAFSYNQNDFKFWINGVEVGTDTSGNTPIGLNSLQFNSGSGGSPFYGKVKQLQVYNTALTDAQLTSLTT